MAREVITKVWCDICLGEDEVFEQGTELPPITMGQMKPRVLALCERHRKEWYEPWKTWVAELGQVASDAAPPAAKAKVKASSGVGVWPCPDPECVKHSEPYSYKQSLQSHTRSEHGMRLEELTKLHGGSLDLELEPVGKRPAVTRAECDQPGCGVVYEWPTHKLPSQAMGVHRARAHGIPGAHKAKGRG